MSNGAQEENRPQPSGSPDDPGPPGESPVASGKEDRLPTVDIRDVEDWKEEPAVTFDQAASLEIARWILSIFAGVIVICFVLTLIMFRFDDATFDNGLEVIKFMVGSILPLATLAVGYYLGERRALQRDHE